jgi:polar amino acid transport system permease protein
LPYHWHFDVLLDNWPILLDGVGMTILVSVISMCGALIAGLLLALARLSKSRILRIPAYCYTEFFRTTPFLVQLMWIFYALPRLGGPALSPFTAGTISMILNLSAFMGEIYRAGVMAVPNRLVEAGLALGFTKGDTQRRITLPIAFRQMLPLTATMWIALFKDSSILSIIGTAELMYDARVAAVDTFRPLEIFTGVAAIYFLLTYPQSLVVNYLYEKYLPKE